MTEALSPNEAMGQPKFTEGFESRHRYQPGEDMTPVTTNATNTSAITSSINHNAATADGTTDEGPKRHGTLKKKTSLSRRLSTASAFGADPENKNSIFYTPIPTKNNPTEILVKRFNAWRKVLKDFIAYFREVQSQYEARARGITKVTHLLNSATNPTGPSEFCTSGGLLETNNVLRDFHKEAFSNSESASKIETEVISNLTGLRADLKLKVSEIKVLSGDFKNNVDKEKENTKKEIAKLQEALQALDTNPAAGKDPYITRLAVEKQLRKYLTEENYLHRAYLNIESSGRELESIVVGEVQKAYETYVKIMKREGQELLDMAERLTMTTLRLPRDYEWNSFLERDSHFVDPQSQLRTFEHIEYPGCQNPSIMEVYSGNLERKSKYLKSFTGGWYVLSPTHLHEFKTADRTRDQTPVMSLYLPDSTLGKCSDPSAVSHKFILKGRQTGNMHRGHNWVFRAESHEAMLEWYEAIKKLTEVTGAARNAFVESAVAHRRQTSTASAVMKPEVGDNSDTYSSENGLENDEADQVPYSSQHSLLDDKQSGLEPPKRPEGGRFPSDIQIHRTGLQCRTSSSSSAEAIAAATALPGSSYPNFDERDESYQPQATYGESAYSPTMQQQPNNGLDQNYILVSPSRQKERDRSDTVSSWSCDDEKQPLPEDVTITADGVERVNRAEPVPAPVPYAPARAYSNYGEPKNTYGQARTDSNYGENAYTNERALDNFDSTVPPSSYVAYGAALNPHKATTPTPASVAARQPVPDEDRDPLQMPDANRHIAFGIAPGTSDYYSSREADNIGPPVPAKVREDEVQTDPLPTTSYVAVESPGPASGIESTAMSIPLGGAAEATHGRMMDDVLQDQEVGVLQRPPPPPHRNSKETVDTISDLHVPGQYPRGQRSSVAGYLQREND